MNGEFNTASESHRIWTIPPPEQCISAEPWSATRLRDQQRISWTGARIRIQNIYSHVGDQLTGGTPLVLNVLYLTPFAAVSVAIIDELLGQPVPVRH